MGQMVSQMTTTTTRHTIRRIPTEVHLRLVALHVFIHPWLPSPLDATRGTLPMFSAFVVPCVSTHLIIRSAKFSQDTQLVWPVWNLLEQWWHLQQAWLPIFHQVCHPSIARWISCPPRCLISSRLPLYQLFETLSHGQFDTWA